MANVTTAVAVTYILLHFSIFFGTFCLIARSTLPPGTSILSKPFWLELFKTFRRRPLLASFCVLHFLDVGFDYGVILGWMSQRNAMRDAISFNGGLLIFPLLLHIIYRVTSSLYIFSLTRESSNLPAIMQSFDCELYYDIYFERECTSMDLKIEQLYRGYAVMQSFPMAVIQCYLLVAYGLVSADNISFTRDASDTHFISFTALSLITSIAFILCLQITHDARFLNVDDASLRVLRPKWCIRALFRIFELLSRVLLLTYIWVLYGILSVLCVVCLEWCFQLFNHYRKQRYDNSSEHAIRMWRKQNKLFLWPLLMDELISFWNLDWKLPASNAPIQRDCNVVDVLQMWTLASYIYGNKYVRKATRDFPRCQCNKPMDEYFSSGIAPMLYNRPHAQPSVNIDDDYGAAGTRTRVKSKSSIASSSNASGTSKKKAAKIPEAYTNPHCASCHQFVAIQEHYFRCPSFLQSGNVHDATSEKITKHGRYICLDCGYARMTYLPFLFVVSRNAFTCAYVALLTSMAVGGVDCMAACIGDDGRYNNEFHRTAYQSTLFVIAMLCQLLCPLMFVAFLSSKQLLSREMESASFDGQVVHYARQLDWSKVYELIHREECDLNEVDRDGRSALLYAAISHNFQVIRDLQNAGAALEHVDINACGVTFYLDALASEDGTPDSVRVTTAMMTTMADPYGQQERQDLHRTTAATKAAKHGSEEDLHLCIELGCDLNKMDGDGHTPLLIACKEREVAIVRILVQQANLYGCDRVDLNKPDDDGRTAVIIATQYGYLNVLETLLNDAKPELVDVLHRDHAGKTAFEHAIGCNHKKCARVIHAYKKRYNLSEDDVVATQKQKPHAHAPPTGINVGLSQQQQMHQRTPSDLVDSDSEHAHDDDDVNGDVKKHPIYTPSKSWAPSPALELHESDSIDRRIVKHLTFDTYKQMHKEQQAKATEETNGNIQKQMSIIVTNADRDAHQ